jgi:hypothetical protein
VSGTYHLFATRWPGSTGFGNWVDSAPIHAVSTGGPLGLYMDNGFAYGPAGPGGPGDPHKGHNVVSIVPRPDGSFEIVQRHGLIGLSTTGICGPYKLQNPTNTYPSSEQPSFASIYPNRQKHLDPMAPEPPESTYTLAEDPVIWYSSGLCHVIYDYPDDRVGYHLTSPDSIHTWTDQGLAYDPRYAKQIFSYPDGTVNNWYKMERPNVLIENGHVTQVT